MARLVSLAHGVHGVFRLEAIDEPGTLGVHPPGSQDFELDDRQILIQAAAIGIRLCFDDTGDHLIELLLIGTGADQKRIRPGLEKQIAMANLVL